MAKGPFSVGSRYNDFSKTRKSTEKVKTSSKAASRTLANARSIHGRPELNNFFSSNSKYAFHSGKGGIASTSGSRARKMVSHINKGGVLDQGKYESVGGITKLNGFVLPRHYGLISQAIDRQLWLFVQAMGSHAERMFKDSFTKKMFSHRSWIGGTRWKGLSQKTKKRRELLGLWPGNPPGRTLVATGQLLNSIKMKVGAGKIPMVSIYTDKDAFKGVYPEWVNTGQRGKRNKEYVAKRNVKNVKIHNRTATPLVYGRKDRVYAGIHNEGLGTTPRRQFMGVSNAFFGSTEEQLMDVFLFYSVFNSSLGALTNKQVERNKGFERKSELQHYRAAEAQKLRREREMYGMNDGAEGSVISSGGDTGFDIE